jgi:hypothetical protein
VDAPLGGAFDFGIDSSQVHVFNAEGTRLN